MRETIREVSYVTASLITYESDRDEETVPAFTAEQWRNQMQGRDYRIWFAFNRGAGLEAICKRTGLTPRDVQRICRDQDAAQKTGGLSGRIARAVQEMQKVTKEEKKLATGLYVLLEAFGGVRPDFPEVPCLAARDHSMYGAVAHV